MHCIDSVHCIGFKHLRLKHSTGIFKHVPLTSTSKLHMPGLNHLPSTSTLVITKHTHTHTRLCVCVHTLHYSHVVMYVRIDVEGRPLRPDLCDFYVRS